MFARRLVHSTFCMLLCAGSHQEAEHRNLDAQRTSGIEDSGFGKQFLTCTGLVIVALFPGKTLPIRIIVGTPFLPTTKYRCSCCEPQWQEGRRKHLLEHQRREPLCGEAVRVETFSGNLF